MMTTMLANVLVLFQFAMKDHLAAIATFMPEIVGYILFLPTDQLTQLRANDVFQPVHL